MSPDPLGSPPAESHPAAPRGRFPWPRQFAKLWGFALFCIAIVIVFRAVVLPFLFALLVAYLLAPIVDWLAARRVAGRSVPRFAAVIACYTVVLGLVVLFFTAFLPRLSGDFARLFREAPQLFHRVNEEYVPRAGQLIDRYLGVEEEGEVGSDPEPQATGARARVRQAGEGEWEIDLRGMELEVRPTGGGYVIAARETPPAEPGVGRWERGLKRWITDLVKSSESHLKEALVLGQLFVTGVIKAFATFVLVLMVAAFLLVDLAKVRHFLRSLVPDAYQNDFEVVLEGVDRGLSGVIRGQLIICLLNGALTWIGLMLFHVKYPLLLAVVATVMSLIPVFGSILSSVPIVAVAVIGGPHGFAIGTGLAMLGWICAVHLIEANIFNPKIMGTAAKIHPVVVIFALLAGEQTYGLTGALFAVPVASIVQTLFLYFRGRAWTARSTVSV